MKKLTTLLIVCAMSLSVSAQKLQINQIFDRYQEAEGVTAITVAKPMFRMLSKMKVDDEDMQKIMPLLNKVNSLKMLIMEAPDKSTDTNALMRTRAQNEIASAVKGLNYQELITVNSKDSKIKFLTADTTKDTFDNLLLSINSEGNSILMMLDGKVSMDDISRLISEEQTTAKK